jgi:hypothetical protein
MADHIAGKPDGRIDQDHAQKASGGFENCA